MVKFLFGAVVTLMVALALTLRYSAVVSGEKERLLGNQTALLAEQREYQLRDSLNAVSVSVLTMKAAEFQSGFERLSAIVRDMDVKLKRVESVSQTAIEGNYDVVTPIRDTIVASSPDTLHMAQAIRFSNKHLELNGVIMDSVFTGTITTRDTLTQILHRIPRRFLFIHWGVKELRQEIVSSNPNTHIIYNHTIRVKK